MAVIVATWLRPGEVALKGAVESYLSTGSMMDALEAGLATAEDDPDLIAIGRGSVPNEDGEIELDASIMDGRTMNAGAVCGVRGILPVISLARMVMERTNHVMLAGEQARRFALEQGMTAQNLMTPDSIRRYEEWAQSEDRPIHYVHSVEDGGPDTVTMLGWEAGRVTAASSTSGMPFKVPGRIGDSPIIGAGIYADDLAGAAGATGWGEELWKAGASLRTVEAMRDGLSAQEACEKTIRFMLKRRPGCDRLPIVVLAIDREGRVGAACAGGAFDLWVWMDGATECLHFDPIEGE